MSHSLQDLITAVQAKGYSYAQSVTDPTNPVVQALNSAYRQILGLQRWPFLEKQDTSIVTVAGQYAYPMSSIADLVQLDAVRLEQAGTQQYVELENADPQTLHRLWQLDRTQDQPSYWTMHAGNIELYPTPDNAYTLRVDYIFRPPDMAAATDVPVVPDVYMDVLVWGAVQELAFRERDWLGRNFAEGMYQQRLKQFSEEFSLRQRQTSSHVVSSGTWDTNRLVPGFGRVGW